MYEVLVSGNSFRCIKTRESGDASMKSCSSSGCRFQKVNVVGTSRWTAINVGENAYTSPNFATVSLGPVSLIATASVNTITSAAAFPSLATDTIFDATESGK